MEGLLQTYGKSFAVGVLCVSALLMGYVIYEISIAKQQFANRLITSSVTQSESELDNFFERVNNLIHSVGHQYESGFWDGVDQRKKVLHSISLVEHYEPISSIGIADLRGYELNILPELSSDNWFTREVFVDRWGNTARWSRWMVGDSLVRTDQWESELPIDPRERPWFRGALRSKGGIYWTEPYEYTTGPEIGITASRLYESEVDSLSRIIAFDLTLNDLNEFVQNLHLTDHQGIYILDADFERVIAFQAYSETPELDMFALKDSSEGPVLKKNMQRIKIIALIQEEIYKSETLGMTSLNSILERLFERHEEFTTRLHILPEVDEIRINVNQAMTYGILLHEILSGLNPDSEDDVLKCQLRIMREGNKVITTFQAQQHKTFPESCRRVVESDVVQALSRQLSADLSLMPEPALEFQVIFELQDRKGVVSTRSYA